MNKHEVKRQQQEVGQELEKIAREQDARRQLHIEKPLHEIVRATRGQ